MAKALLVRKIARLTSNTVLAFLFGFAAFCLLLLKLRDFRRLLEAQKFMLCGCLRLEMLPPV